MYTQWTSVSSLLDKAAPTLTARLPDRAVPPEEAADTAEVAAAARTRIKEICPTKGDPPSHPCMRK